MPFNFGSFAGGAAKGISQGIQDNAAREDAEWKKKERARLEADHQTDDSVNAQTAEYVSDKKGLDWGAFGAAARGENVGEFISKRDDAEWKRKERARVEADKKLDDDVDKKSRDYALSRVAIAPDGGKDVQGSPAATTQSAPVMRNPAVDGITRNPGGTEGSPQQDISERPDIGLAASSSTANAVRSGVNIRKAQQPQANATLDNSEAPAQPKYRKPNVDDMIDVAQHRAQLYLNAGKYDKATAAHKDYMAFAAEKLKVEESHRSGLAKNAIAGIMAGDYSGLGSFYEALPDGNKLQNVTPNKDGTITISVVGRDGKAKPPVTFKNGEHLANAVVSMSDTNAALQYMDRNGKAEIEADKTKFEQDYKNRDLTEKGRHNKAVEDVYRNKPQLTTSQQRINQEIQAARNAIAGMSPEAIKTRTQQYSTTGRENPDYDPMLASRVRQANHRKYGEDTDFADIADPKDDAMQDIGARFASDPAMKGRRIGNKTPQGVEVFDANGKLVGHYN